MGRQCPENPDSSPGRDNVNPYLIYLREMDRKFKAGECYCDKNNLCPEHSQQEHSRRYPGDCRFSLAWLDANPQWTAQVISKIQEPVMIPPNTAAPNDVKIASQLDYLKRIRSAGSLSIGWDDDQVPPSVVRALELAGLVTVDASVSPRIVKPV